MKKLLLTLIILITAAVTGYCDDELSSYKVKEDEYDIQHSFYFKTFVVNNTGKTFDLDIYNNGDGYGEFIIGEGNFISKSEQMEQTEFVWKKGCPVKRELNFPVLKLNEEHPRYEDSVAEAKLNPGKSRTVKNAVEMVFHKQELFYDDLQIKVRFEVSGNSDVLFIIIDSNDSKNDHARFI